MTPTNELTYAKLQSNEIIRNELHPSELKYLLNLVEDDVNRSWGIFNWCGIVLDVGLGILRK